MPHTPSHEVMKAAIDRAGVKAVSAKLGLSQASVYKWCAAPEGSGTPSPLDRLAALIEITGDPSLAEWISEASGGIFVPNPPARRQADPLKVLAQTQKLVREFSDLLDVIAQSMADGKVSAAEARRIREEWEQLKRHAEGFVRACEPAATAP